MKLSTEVEKYIMIAVLAWDWTDTEALLVQKTLNSVIYWSNVLAPIFNMDYPFKYKMSGDNNIFEIKSSKILQPGPAALTDGLEEMIKIFKKVKL